MKKFNLPILIFTFAALLIIAPGYALASYTEYTAGNQGVYSAYDSGKGVAVTAPLVTQGKDSIVAVTVRYRRVSGQNVGCRFFPAKDSTTNYLGPQIDSDPIVDTTWSSPVTYTIADGGYNSFRIYGFTTTTTDAVILQMEILSMKVRRYDIDSINLSLESDGYIHTSFANSTPNGSLQYTIKNNQTGSFANNSSTWTDTSVGVGKSYSYTLTWGFYPYKNQVVDMGGLYIPMDTDLTNRVNTVISNTSSVNGNTVDAVRDASGTVLSEAREAKTNSLSASTNAQNAYNTAQTVNTKVDALTTAVNDINTSIIGVSDDNSLITSAVRDPNGTVLTVTRDSYEAVEDPNGNTITAVRDNNGTVLDASRSANEKIDTLQTTVNNIQNTLGNDTTSPVVKVKTVSGAWATSGSSIRAVINASDNVSTVFEYSLDGTDYQPLPSDGVIVLPVSTSGSNLITVWVKDEAGNVGRDSITIRKL